MITEDNINSICEKWKVMAVEMDERARRLWAASEAKVLGLGGISVVSRATGIAIDTIRTGIAELREDGTKQPSTRSSERRIRREGGGRKSLTQKDKNLQEALKALVDSTTRGDPMSPLRWTCKSTRRLAEELGQQGHPISDRTVAMLLKELDYSLQGNQKTIEGGTHPDRNAQFEHISAQVKAFQARGQPVISVDTKKKELVGNYKNGGQEWNPKDAPTQVRVHDFGKKKAIPYGVYDVTENKGWVSVGVDHDTSEFAVQSILQWWRQMGIRKYPQASELLITADGGGSNGSRVRLWKVALQRLADETGMRIFVCHLPPGTSKWNKIEHRMFCHITKNWRGQPLESYEVIVNLIGHTTTAKGLKIQAALDTNSYAKGIKVRDAELAKVQLERGAFHGDWNYTISPTCVQTLAKTLTT